MADGTSLFFVLSGLKDMSVPLIMKKGKHACQSSIQEMVPELLGVIFFYFNWYLSLIFLMSLGGPIVYAQKNEPFPRIGCHIHITDKKGERKIWKVTANYSKPTTRMYTEPATIWCMTRRMQRI